MGAGGSGALSPDGDFDPRTLDAAARDELGVPPPPDSQDRSGLYERWMSMFGRTLRVVSPSWPPPAAGPAKPYVPSPLRPPPIITPANHTEGSSNWSGAYLAAAGGKTFTQIWGQWTVPSPRPPADAKPGPMTYQCAAWIGLDGIQIYRDASLPQIGTNQELTVAADGTLALKSYALTEWYHRDGESKPTPIDNFPVSPGDSISCVLTVLTPHSVLMNIVNQSTTPPAFAAVRRDAPVVTFPDGSSMQLSIAGATAEWIFERTGIVGTTEKYAFPDYGSVNFTGCHAVDAPPGGGPASGRQLKNPRFIRMYDVYSSPQRTGYVSMPNRIDSTSFNVTYGDFWL